MVKSTHYQTLVVSIHLDFLSMRKNMTEMTTTNTTITTEAGMPTARAMTRYSWLSGEGVVTSTTGKGVRDHSCLAC